MFNPKILFEPKTFVDIMLAATSCDIEVSGLAKVKKEDDIYIVHGNVAIFEQTCSMDGTHLDPDALNTWLQKMTISNRGKDLPLFRSWWHSHVYAKTRPSITDRTTMEQVWRPTHDWQIMMIVNKFLTTYLELDIFRPQDVSPIVIRNFGFTEKFTSEDFQRLARKRFTRISKIVSSKVREVKIP